MTLMNVSRRSGHAALAFGLVMLAAGCASSGPASSDGDQGTARRLWAIANRLAAANGGTIFAANAVESTHSKAVQVTMGDIVPGDERVWVVQVEGNRPFVCNGCTGPPGAKAPTGRYLVLVVDARTFEGTDFGIGPKVADLTKLGPVVRLHG